MLTRIRLPAKKTYLMYNLWLVSCSSMLSKYFLSSVFNWALILTTIQANKLLCLKHRGRYNTIKDRAYSRGKVENRGYDFIKWWLRKLWLRIITGILPVDKLCIIKIHAGGQLKNLKIWIQYLDHILTVLFIL